MNRLFPEEKVWITFNGIYKDKFKGNRREYFIGTEKGLLQKFSGDVYSGYEFISDNGCKYFISTNKSQIPPNYDAAFVIEKPKEKLTIPILSKCKKKLEYIKPPSIQNVIESWKDCFTYKKELKDRSGNIIQFGLRPPQIGAFHSIQAHWSISPKPALVVMPTGTGKTETMLCLSVAEKCQGLLVIVPSDSLRNQIFNKFKTLGILKNSGFEVIAQTAKNPIVGFLKTGIKNIDDANGILNSNIIISTPQIITTILKDDSKIKDLFLNWCGYLIMDEAHHSQAKEWNIIKLQIESLNKPILLFTATPFRNDKKRLAGKIIYDYPLSLAQKDNYYKNIIFHPILEFNPKIADKKIAEKAISLLELDRLEKLDHILMARVDTMKKAEEIFEFIYKPYKEYNPVFIHSNIKSAERKKILEDIVAGKHKIIVCVDMLGEGFDLPQLKICALHDIHKNITTSFQFFGRFTRESSLNLGKASIVANIADPKLKGTLKKLYQKDSDWDKIIRHANEDIMGAVKKEQDFFQNFSDVEISAKIPLRNITPAMSTVVFKLYDTEIQWTPENYVACFTNEKYETVSVEHEEENLLVIIAKKTDTVKWGQIEDLLTCEYDLYILYLNLEQKLLFINSTNNGTTHDKLAKAVVGKNLSLFNEAEIYKCLDGIFQLELFNLGLKSILSGPISFTMYAGSSIISGLDELDKNTKSSSNLFGVGYENGEKMTIGCSSKGRVWTKLVKTIPEFCLWCDALGNKLLDDTIDVKNIFKFIQKPERKTNFPSDKVPIAIKWNEELYIDSNMATYLGTPIVDFTMTILAYSNNSLDFQIFSNQAATQYRLVIKKSIRGYEYSRIAGMPFNINYKGDQIEIIQLFHEFPPIIWFHDNSKMYNNIFFSFKDKISIFDTSKLIPLKWDGVNIKKESQKKEKRNDSIQYYIINKLKTQGDYKLIFDDDDANEASDIIAINFDETNNIRIELYHCKFSSKTQSGSRLKDLYEVCGQAQRSFHWKHNTFELLQHMVRRQNKRMDQYKKSRYEIGGDEELRTLTNMITSGYCNLDYSIYVVQPGISKKAIEKESEHLKILGATDLLLKKTGNTFYVIVSD
ncbi:MAG: DEAD/DEAH box helicase family protein [Niabella sp.]|nr:DEAD/DEAH box helicase family protein [Niabella sp.]